MVERAHRRTFWYIRAWANAPTPGACTRGREDGKGRGFEMHFIKTMIAGSVLAGISLSAALPAVATEEVAPARAERDWSVSFSPYVWAVSMSSKVETDRIDGDYDLGLLTILENLRGLAMADMTVRYKRVGLVGDGMWSRLEKTQTRATATGSYDIDVQLNLAWGTGGAFYRFRPTEKLSLDPYVAARWWRVNTRLGLIDNGGPLAPRSGEGTTAWADPVFGLKVNYDITDKWSVRVAGDVGGGVSKVSWQVLGGGAYNVNDWLAIDVVYRAMGVDYRPSGDRFVLSLNGLAAGVTFHY
jgi:opacity protein-like surface antigen